MPDPIVALLEQAPGGVSKNLNLKIVQEMLGHATISQIMDTYSYVLPGMQDEAAAALESALF